MKTLKRGSFAKWGAEGGSAKTKAKTQAARRNGKKGGRPPKLRPWMAYYGGSYHYELMAKKAFLNWVSTLSLNGAAEVTSRMREFPSFSEAADYLKMHLEGERDDILYSLRQIAKLKART